MPESERVLVGVSDDGSQGKCREVCSESARLHRFRVCGVGREVTGGTGGLGMSKGQGSLTDITSGRLSHWSFAPSQCNHYVPLL